MSNSNGHLSASARRIRELEQQVQVLMQMHAEYNVFLNYVVGCHGAKVSDLDGVPLGNYAIADGDPERVFTIDTDRLKKLVICTIRTEISKDGKSMEIRRVPDAPQETEPQSRIILP